ncbi:arginase [Homoserinimonas aerilata]|uniref:Arginase n=1 Tax=Homoserinimonas aerilata TaxID=1162970 RepID=A0A542YKA9_9MICO|nr:arginase family protein [Homoserinimonas aerilata]TQL48536.1 arginase [Homoserinimonas aerilata]
MAASFYVVPQWQGSGSSRAMRLADGAAAIRGDLPSASTTVIDVPAEAGDAQDTGVHRLSSIAAVRDRLADALASRREPAITIGGDCGVELAAIEHAARGRTLAVVWFDAHADLNNPEGSPSSAFHGMVLRTLLGDGPEALLPQHPLAAEQVVLAGTRALDDGEQEYIETTGIRMLGPLELGPDALVTAVEATGADSVYLHIDLDVLDPGIVEGLGYPVPFGLTAATLVESIRALRRRFEFAGAGITEFAPASREQAEGDLPTILRIIGALTATP